MNVRRKKTDKTDKRDKISFHDFCFLGWKFVDAKVERIAE
jgi:hypothetical protein